MFNLIVVNVYVVGYLFESFYDLFRILIEVKFVYNDKSQEVCSCFWGVFIEIVQQYYMLGLQNCQYVQIYIFGMMCLLVWMFECRQCKLILLNCFCCYFFFESVRIEFLVFWVVIVFGDNLILYILSELYYGIQVVIDFKVRSVIGVGIKKIIRF